MSTLTGKFPGNTYGDLVKLGTGSDNDGLTATLVNLQDGFGNNSTLKLSTTAAEFSSTVTPEMDNSYDLGASGQRWATVYGVATSAQYADLAERYESDETLEPGTVVVFGGSHEITACKIDADTAVAGVISTAPAFKMNDDAGSDETHPHVALKGKVPCKVHGTVSKGDLLVTSGRMEGHAMSAGKEAAPYTVVAKALEDFDGEAGVIMVVVI